MILVNTMQKPTIRPDLFIALIALIALFAGACGTSPASDVTMCTPTCRAGYACSAGTCVVEANVCVPSCRAGFACSAGTCVAETVACVPSCRGGFSCEGGACAEGPQAERTMLVP